MNIKQHKYVYANKFLLLHSSLFILTCVAKRNDYFYDVVGNRTKLIDETNVETTYEYDSLYRLTRVNGKYYNKEGQIKGSKYTYDQVGNRLTYNSKYGKITYEYDEGSNRLNRVNFNLTDKNMSYMLINYDANGNTIQRDYFRNKDEIFEQELYEYNYDNMMVHYVRHKPVMMNNRIEMEVESELNMKYDVNGIRVIKECYPNTDDSIIYIYEGGEVVLEMTYEQIPKNKHLFTYAGGKKVSRISFNTDGIINLDSRKYFHQNFLGSIAMLTDKDGNIEEHNKYEPFGDIIWSKSYIDTDNNYKFTGKERDKESNLDYFNARYLDNKLGRFMKADVMTGDIKNPQTLNRWVYCVNNPIKYVDNNGLYIDAILLKGRGGGRNYKGFYNINKVSDVTRVIKTKKGALRKLNKPNSGPSIFVYSGEGGSITGRFDMSWQVIWDFEKKSALFPVSLRGLDDSKLILLVACYTAMTMESKSTPFGISEKTKGRALIAFRTEITMTLDKPFIKEYFNILSKGETVYDALLQAYYNELYEPGGHAAKKEWKKFIEGEKYKGSGVKEEHEKYIDYQDQYGRFEAEFEKNVFFIGDKNLQVEELDDEHAFTTK